jgi:hypothetical protein
MKKTTLTEDAPAYQTFFDENDFTPNQMTIGQASALQSNAQPDR